MLLNAVIIILREVLEAALLTSVLLALSQMMKQDKRWIVLALTLGMIAAYLYAANIQIISNAFEGVGQEIFNAFLHSLIFLALFGFFISSYMTRRNPAWRHIHIAMMILAVMVGTGREGAEIILYIRGFWAIPDLLTPVLLGSVVGAGIGLSVGVFFYYLLVNLRPSFGLWIAMMILMLLGGSMISQAAQFLIQADILSASTPVWDSSTIISERSISGQLLYALIGYEATPALVQVIAYGISIGLIASAAIVSKNSFKGNIHD